MSVKGHEIYRLLFILHNIIIHAEEKINTILLETVKIFFADTYKQLFY